jgi:HK97 family phage portal protein
MLGQLLSLFQGNSAHALTERAVTAMKPQVEERAIYGTETAFWSAVSGGAVSKAGELVNSESAQQQTAVWACMRVLSETISSLSWDIYTDDGKGNRQKQPNHPVARLLRAPHPLYNGQTWLETMQSWATLRGNAISVIMRNGAGLPIGLRHVTCDQVNIDYDPATQMLYYTIYDRRTGKPIVLDHNDVLHVRAYVSDVEDGWGVSPISKHRDTVGLSLAGKRYMSELMRNGAHVKGYLSTDDVLKPDVSKRMKKSWQAAHAGAGNAGKTPVLEAGVKFHQLNLSPADAEWLKMMQFSVAEISRIFGVPMHMLSALERSTNNNIEHQGREFITHTVRPWVKRYEAEINQKLFSGRSSSYFRFNMDSYLIGDAEARSKLYATYMNYGITNADEIRRLEGMNAKPNGEGEEYLYPVNMAPMSALGQNINNGTEEE